MVGRLLLIEGAHRHLSLLRRAVDYRGETRHMIKLFGYIHVPGTSAYATRIYPVHSISSRIVLPGKILFSPYRVTKIGRAYLLACTGNPEGLDGISDDLRDYVKIPPSNCAPARSVRNLLRYFP